MIVLKAAQEKLLGALHAVAGIVERRHTLPILANVLLRKNAGDIEFTTSDLEIQVRTKADLSGDAGVFSTTLGARKLIDILRTACSTVVWSRPPKLSPISGRLFCVISLARYIAIWRGRAMLAGRFLLYMSATLIL